MQIGGGAPPQSKILPRLEEIPEEHRALRFHDWWQQESILRDGGYSLTRQTLVGALRNQEGGAHYDPVPNNPNYLRFVEAGETTPHFLVAGQPRQPVLGVHLATMRQIAWELVTTLEAVEIE